MSTSTVALGPAFAPAPKPELVGVSIGGETVIYAPDSDALHHLDRTASTVWEQLSGDVALDVLARQLAAGHHAEPVDVMAYLMRLAETLWQRGLLDGSVAAPQFTGRKPGEHPTEANEATVSLGQALPPAPHRTRRFRAIGHCFDVATNDSAVRDYLNYALADLADSATCVATRYELLVIDQHSYLLIYGSTPLAATDWLDRALSLLLWHINTEAARRATATGPVIHAAAATRQARAVLLPAPAESGKTTTVAGLVRAGFGYLTDEAVAIDPDTLLAAPYPKPLSIDRGSWAVLADLRPPHSDRMAGQWQVPARHVRPHAASAAAPVRFVVVPTFHHGAATALEPMSPAETLLKIADSTFHFGNHPRRNLEVLARIVREAECYRFPISDLDDGVQLIEGLFDRLPDA
ncbi:MAG TPA: PqqD family protein [Jiangellaceae bacterium]